MALAIQTKRNVIQEDTYGMIQINLKRGGRGWSSLPPLQVFAGAAREQILKSSNY